MHSSESHEQKFGAVWVLGVQITRADTSEQHQQKTCKKQLKGLGNPLSPTDASDLATPATSCLHLVGKDGLGVGLGSHVLAASQEATAQETNELLLYIPQRQSIPICCKSPALKNIGITAVGTDITDLEEQLT